MRLFHFLVKYLEFFAFILALFCRVAQCKRDRSSRNFEAITVKKCNN